MSTIKRFKREPLSTGQKAVHDYYYREHLSLNEREAMPTGADTATASNKLITASTTDAIEADVLALETASVLIPGTPENAVASAGLATFIDGSTQGEIITIGLDVYEVDIDAAGVTGLPITLLSGDISKEAAGTALTAAVVANAGSVVAAVDNADGTVSLTADVAGVAGDLIVLTEVGDHITVDGAGTLGTAVAGVDGTVGQAGEVLYDATNVYVSTAANTIADANWKKLTLLSL